MPGTVTGLAGEQADDDAVEVRREMVAHLRLRQATVREIVKMLDEKGIVNPNSGKPWTRNTVHLDLVHLREKWKANAARDTAELIASQLAELEAIKRQAWAANDMPILLRAMAAEREIHGINAPTKVALTDADGGQLTWQVVLALARGEQPALPAAEPQQVIDVEAIEQPAAVGGAE